MVALILQATVDLLAARYNSVLYACLNVILFCKTASLLSRTVHDCVEFWYAGAIWVGFLETVELSSLLWVKSKMAYAIGTKIGHIQIAITPLRIVRVCWNLAHCGSAEVAELLSL